MPNANPFAPLMQAPSNEEPIAGSGAPGHAPESERSRYETFGDVLQEALGYYAECEFLVGTSHIEIKEGILYEAGTNFVTLRDLDGHRYTICDLYALKFVTVHDRVPQPQPRNNASRGLIGR